MPNKDPNVWTWLIDFIKQTPTSQGVIMSMIIAALRVMYYGERKPLRIGLEALLCGFLSLSVSGLLDFISIVFHIDIPVNFIVTVSSAIGFIGVTALHDFLVNFINKRVGSRPPRYNAEDDEDNYL